MNLNFKDTKDDKTRVIGFFAKKARGMMARALIENRTSKIDDIKNIVVDDYRFNIDLSDENNWVYERTQPPPVKA